MGRSKGTNYVISTSIAAVCAISWFFLFTYDSTGEASMTFCSPQSTQRLLDDRWSTINWWSKTQLWVLMVFAMMSPKLITPVSIICERSFRHLRIWVSLIFIMSYVMVWALAGVVLQVVFYGLESLMQGYSDIWLVVIVVLATVFWQMTPLKQQFLNRGHRQPTISAFGWNLIMDTVLFGVSHGVWCVCSGWLVMLLPMGIPQLHFVMMAVITLIMLSEHLAHPKSPKWGLHFPEKLFVLCYQQSKLFILSNFGRFVRHQKVIQKA